jgi:regulator of protease activity HflC (stomatin/prohibitin superfamily)
LLYCYIVITMPFIFVLVLIVIVFIILPGFRVVQQYEKGAVFLFGKITSIKDPGLVWIIPYFSWMRKVDLRTITLPIPAQRIITKDNVSLDVSAVAYYKIVDVTKSIVGIENVMSAINQLSQTTMRNIVGKFQLDEILSERDTINGEIRSTLDARTEEWGVIVSAVEIKDIELPENMQRAMAKQAEAEREKRAKIIAAEGEFLSVQKLSEAADVIAAHPIALQLRNLQTMAEIAVEKNSTIIFPAQFMGTVQDIKKFIEDEGGKVNK